MDVIAQAAIANNVVSPSMADTSMEDWNASSFPPVLALTLASMSPIIGLDESDLKTSIIPHKPTRSSTRLAARCTTLCSVADGISFRVFCIEDQPLVNSSSYSSTASVKHGGFDRSNTISSFYEDH
ncbi:hypothetical protein AMTRI_Chr13g89450 [Amborella trichopoda]